MSRTRAKPPGGGAMKRAMGARRSAPCVEAQARTILAALVEEAVTESTGLKLPEPQTVETAPVAAMSEPIEPAAGAGIDEMATQDLIAIAQHGASLELDGLRFSSEELTLLAENVGDDAHLKIANSGSFTREELSAIALSAPGQVIFA